MMRDIGLECDSFDEDDIDELEKDLQHLEGPSLSYFQLQQANAIFPLTSKSFMKTMVDQDSRDIKLIGNQKYAEYQAFFYVLLLLGVEERKNYPHLNTFIREQFYKPNIFQLSDQTRAEMPLAAEMLEKSLRYFQQIGEGVRLEDYLVREPIFQEAGIVMLRNSVELQQESNVFQQLAAKFNIDVQVLKREDESECYQFGTSKRYHIFREGEYYFVATADYKDDLGNSRYEIQSVRSGESGLQLVPEASEHSTPKFKNSEIRYHKKSHKNSFGGDMEIVQYRDLLHMQSQRLNKGLQNLSEYMDLNEVESCAQHMVDAGPKTHNFGDILKTDANEVKTEMKGSTTLEPIQHFAERRKDRKISSSQIIECKDFGTRLIRHESLPQPQEQSPPQEERGASYNSLVMLREEGKMRTSIIKGKQLERIEERQSSQKESTHPDQESEREYQAEMGVPASAAENEMQMKLKDRKYSYFTQQMASSKSKKQKEIDNSDYVFKLPKNAHKSSQVIEGLDSEYIKRRFQENPLRFSQLGSPSEESYHEHHTTIARHLPSLKLNSTVFSYLVKFEPDHWLKKEIIYYLPNNTKEILVFEKSFPRPVSPAPLSEETRPNNSTMLRDSMGSSNSFFSNIKSQQSFTTKDQGQPQPSYNPYQLNESSFLKNRIQSMSQLQPFQKAEPNQDSKSIIFGTCKSLKSIRLSPDKSPPKISFNYISSPTASGPGSSAFRPRNLPFNYVPSAVSSRSSIPTLENRFFQGAR